MNKGILERFRQGLLLHQSNLLGWLSGDLRQKQIHCGRYGDDENEAITTESLPIFEDIENALEQIERNEFGKCRLCDGDVETERLELDFTTTVCLSHYSDSQLRELESDLELAAKVQKHLLPATTPALSGVQIAAKARQARIVGGDYYDFFCYRDYLQGLTVADVMGKGLPASMLMSNLQASLRILGPEYDELQGIAKRLNELFRHNLKLIRFISMFLGAIDVEHRVFHYCNAGHNPALWWKNASKSIDWLEPTGPAIGLVPDAEFTEKTIQLASGDILLLYTDGLIEARNENGDEFGEDRLAAYISEESDNSAERLMEGLFARLKLFAGGFRDDLTVMILKIE